MIHLPRLVYGCVGVFLLATALTAQAGSVGFVDQSEAAGIAVTNVSGTPTQDYIVDVNFASFIEIGRASCRERV